MSRVRVVSGTLGARVSLPDQPAFFFQHRQFICGTTGMIDLAVARQVLHGRLFSLGIFRVRVEQRPRKQKHIVSAEIAVRLFSRDQQEVAVGESLASLKIDFLLIEPDLAGVIRMPVSVEVGEDGQVDTEVAKHRQPSRLLIDSSHVGELLV